MRSLSNSELTAYLKTLTKDEAAAVLKELKKPVPKTPEGTRKKAAERMLAKRHGEKLVRITTLSPEDRRVRLWREEDDEDWLRAYWSAFSPDEFYPLSPQQRQMVADFRAALEHGGDRAIAASRGEGKTTFAVALTLKEILRGKIRFAVLLAATADNVAAILSGINTALSESLELRRYYPEVCECVADVSGAPQRAKSQIASGGRFDNGQPYEMAKTKFHWAGNELIFPNVPGSPSAGAIIKAKSLESPIRGLKIANVRPDIVLIDDPDTDETINNPDQAAKLLTKIDRSISALGSQKRPVSRIAMVTIASQCAAAAQLTDRAKYPSWRGRRFKFLLTAPTDQAKWEQFVNLCREGWAKSADDDREPPIPIAAHRFYLDDREAMDAGAVVSNSNRYDHRQRPEGGTVEVSALEHYYGFVARNGPAAAQAELDNDPPEIGGVDDDGLSPHRVQHQVSGFPRRVVPSLCELLTMGVDVGKFLLHWVVIAWRTDGTSYVIDYGISKVHGTTRGTEEGMEQAIVSAIRILCSEKTDDPYTNAAGEIIPIALTLVDEGWGVSTSAVRAACRDLRPDVFPAKGEGDGATGEGGRSAGPYHHAQKRTWDILPGDNWRRVTMRKDRIKLYHHNAGYWKDWGIQRWLTPIDRPGCRFVFGEFSERDKEHVAMHAEFSHQVCANCYRDEMKHGRLVRCWGERPGENGDKDHYQDAQELADVAANVMGVRLEIVGGTVAAVDGGSGGMVGGGADAIEEVALGSIGGAGSAVVAASVAAPVAAAPAVVVRRAVEIEEMPLCEMR